MGKVLAHTYITRELWGSTWNNDVTLRFFLPAIHKTGWPVGIRTPIAGTKSQSPAVGRRASSKNVSAETETSDTAQSEPKRIRNINGGP